jgi:hypothetical protein
VETDVGWYCVRTVFRFERSGPVTYEERLTLWQADGSSAAVALAEAEANEYAGSLEACAYTGLAQVYHAFEAPGHGAEVFSLMRESDLGTDAYLTAFFDTGRERQGGVSNG